eukprot:scaffold57340_cov55-Phaeocystis_antarctica.AAC.1
MRSTSLAHWTGSTRPSTSPSSPLVRLAARPTYYSDRVPKLLDPADMVGGEPDKMSVIAYVAKLRQALAVFTEKEEEAARLATERAEARKATLALKVLDFERSANEWSQWTD